jgi:predicted O-linked N-acetylglucosamine transferase (SPINDLY family)
MFRTTYFGQVADRFRQEFVNRGIDPSRVDIRWKLPPRVYLSLYDEIDITLDVFPWSGHTTACESMWQGVPIVTKCGDRHASRMVASVLTSVGHSEWIAHDVPSYIAIAQRLANDLPLLAYLRSNLRAEMAASPLCDAAGFTRRFEAALLSAWQNSAGMLK